MCFLLFSLSARFQCAYSISVSSRLLRFFYLSFIIFSNKLIRVDNGGCSLEWWEFDIIPTSLMSFCPKLFVKTCAGYPTFSLIFSVEGRKAENLEACLQCGVLSIFTWLEMFDLLCFHILACILLCSYIDCLPNNTNELQPKQDGKLQHLPRHHLPILQ